MYFRAAVYGRAKGWISTPRALGMAMGPLVAGMIYEYGGEVFLTTMVFVTILAGLIFAIILTLRPRDGF
jgi:hypothetical protein